MPTAECGRIVPVSVDPLGGGEHGRRRCPTRPRGPAGCRKMGVDDLLRRSRRPWDADTLSLCAYISFGLTQLSHLQHRLPRPGRLVGGGSRPQATVDLSLLELGV